MDGFVVGDWPNIPQEEFDRILTGILREMRGDQLLTIPGIYEILAEEFNNDVLDVWEEAQSIRAEFDSMKQGEDL